jgi:methionyl-tRNA synthetase
VFRCNQYVDRMAPWALRKSDPERMKAVLATLFLCIRDLAIAIRPIVPTSADKLLDQMGIPHDARDHAALHDVNWYVSLARSDFRLAAPNPIFPRLELPEEEEATA